MTNSSTVLRLLSLLRLSESFLDGPLTGRNGQNDLVVAGIGVPDKDE